MSRIRPIAICALEHEGRFLMQELWHEHDQLHFYRAPGGGIELGETALDALHREIREELNSEIQGARLLSIFENIFEYGSETKHEIVFLFSAQLADRQLLEQEEIIIHDNQFAFRAHWVSREEIRSGARVVYPAMFRQMVVEGAF